MPQLHDIVNLYKPEYIWGDGDWEAGFEYWKSREFLTWLYNERYADYGLVFMAYV